MFLLNLSVLQKVVRLQDHFKHTKLVAVNEMSLVGYQMLSFISCRLAWAQERSLSQVKFGAIPIFCFSVIMGS